MSSSEDESDVNSIEEEVAPVQAKKKRRKKKKKKDPNAPKRPMSAFFLYSNANRARVKEENPDAKFGDIAKIMSTEFKAISADERARWDQLNAEDKERYTREMEDYTPPSDDDDSDSDSDDSDAPKKKKKRKKKDPNAPKRGKSAFMFFSMAMRPSIKEANPEATFGGLGKLIGEAWKELGDDDKAPWQEKADEDKVRYEKEMANYEP